VVSAATPSTISAFELQARLAKKGEGYPSPHAANTYDAVWAVAVAITSCKRRGVSPRGAALALQLQNTAFQGVSEVNFAHPRWHFEVSNVVPPYLRSVGMLSLDRSPQLSNTVVWPGGASSPPTAWLWRVAVTCSNPDPMAIRCLAAQAAVHQINRLGIIGGGRAGSNLPLRRVWRGKWATAG